MTQSTVANAFLRAISALVLVFVVWQIAAALTNPLFWPDLPAVLTGLNELYSGGMFWRDTSVTLRAFLGGYVLAAVIGVSLGAALAQVPPFRLTFGTLISWLAAAPLVALAPLTIVWFGLEGIASKLAIAFIAAVFPIAGAIMDLARPLRKTDGTVVADQSSAEIEPKEIRRAILVGLRIGVTPALAAVLVCEMVASTTGLGYVIMNSMITFKVAMVVSAFIAAAIPAIVLTRIIVTIEMRLCA